MAFKDNAALDKHLADNSYVEGYVLLGKITIVIYDIVTTVVVMHFMI